MKSVFNPPVFKTPKNVQDVYQSQYCVFKLLSITLLLYTFVDL